MASQPTVGWRRSWRSRTQLAQGMSRWCCLCSRSALGSTRWGSKARCMQCKHTGRDQDRASASDGSSQAASGWHRQFDMYHGRTIASRSLAKNWAGCRVALALCWECIGCFRRCHACVITRLFQSRSRQKPQARLSYWGPSFQSHRRPFPGASSSGY